MDDWKFTIGTVKEIENKYSRYKKDDKHKNDRPFDGLRVRALIEGVDAKKGDIIPNENIPWAFPLLPKTFQSIPKEGEAVFLFYKDGENGQRYYIGPIISQPQFNTKTIAKNATSLLKPNETEPLEAISNNADTVGAFPKSSDVALIGRGAEDVILRHGSDNKNTESEIQLRVGIRTEPTNDENPNMRGNIIFNGVDPAYIQMKYKKNLSKKVNQEANSIINMVANRINIISNSDDDIKDCVNDPNDMIPSHKMDDVMGKLHQVPKGDKLVELLKLMRECILNHVHPWSGMKQCGDWGGYTEKLIHENIDAILSEYVRIS